MNSRPAWVDAAIEKLTEAGEDFAAARLRLADLALELRARGVIRTDELVDVAHDLEHAEAHITAMRRGLMMSWPDLGNEGVERPITAIAPRVLAASSRATLGASRPGLDRIVRRVGAIASDAASRAFRARQGR